MEDVGSVEVCATVRGESASAELHVTLFTEDGTAHSNIHVYVYIVNNIIVIILKILPQLEDTTLTQRLIQ